MMHSFVSAGDLGLVTDVAASGQGSYWPNEPPILAPGGHYWYDYGSVGRGMHYWKTLPTGHRPSADEQKADLEKHRAAFAYGSVPEGLVEALAQHGLELEPGFSAWVRRNLEGVVVGTVILGIIGLFLPKGGRGGKGRG